MTISTNADTTAEQLSVSLGDRIKGKTVLITGVGPDSIAKVVVEALVSAQVGTIFATARTPSKAQSVFDGIPSKHHNTKLIAIQMDCSDLESVRSAASKIKSYEQRIDVMIFSAGIMASPFEKTKDGFESQFQVCHLAHFLLYTSLQSVLAPNARIVSVTSLGQHAGPVRLDDYNFKDGKEYDPWLGYGQAKSANVLFAKSLAKRGHPAFSVHPGVIRTGIMRHLSTEQEKQLGFSDEHGNQLKEGATASGLHFATVQQGAAQYLYAGFHPDLDDKKTHGSLILECRIANEQAAPHATDEETAEKLWTLSEKLVGQTA